MASATAATPNPLINPHFINLTAREVAIAEQIEHGFRDEWACRLCGKRYKDAFPLITHLLGSCPNGIVDAVEVHSTATLVNLFVHVDEGAAEEMLASFVRVNYVGTHSGFCFMIND